MITPSPAANEDVQITASPEDLRYWSNERLFHEAEKLLFDAFAKIKAAVPYIEQLHERFKRRKRNHAHILGCKNWREFCEKRLHREYQTIYKALKRARQQNEPKPKRKKEPKPQPDVMEKLSIVMNEIFSLPQDRPLLPIAKKLRDYAAEIEALNRKRSAERGAAAKRILKEVA
jgi:hypothetical protein